MGRGAIFAIILDRSFVRSSSASMATRLTHTRTAVPGLTRLFAIVPDRRFVRFLSALMAIRLTHTRTAFPGLTSNQSRFEQGVGARRMRRWRNR
jgi:hypothetical protein